MVPNFFGPVPGRNPTDPDQVEPEPTVGDMSDIEIVLADPVLIHRAAALARLGFNARQARNLAIDRSVDTHRVETALISRGCDHNTAYDIASS